MDTIKTGVSKPKQMDKETVVGKVVEYGVTTPCSSFDHRPDSDKAGYVGESKMESRSSATNAGNMQSKKHKSSGKGQ